MTSLSAPPLTAATPVAESPAPAGIAPGQALVPAPQAVLPAGRTGRRHGIWFGLLAALLIGVAAGFAWWRVCPPALPPGFAQGNGRLEADEIDIDTKFAGRIARLLVDEGDMVRAGQIVAVMDTRDLQEQESQAEALAGQAERTVEEAGKILAQQERAVLAGEAAVSQARRSVEEANANLEQARTVARLAQQELARTGALVTRGFATRQTLDTRQQALDGAIAAQGAATARVGAADQALLAARHAADGAAAARDAAAARVGAVQHARDAARHNVEYVRVNIADNSLTAPRDGPIQYRIANVGEVLAAGGRVFTMLDAGYVYMDVYLPTTQAGRVRIGAEGRVVLDAYPDHVIPARAVFVASEAQFTPKTVETKDERDKLLFRIRLRVDPERLRGREALVRTGLPGVGVVRTDEAVAWPARLAPSPPPAAATGGR
ncbi:HlyD family secretion protein [Methylobacterium sp. SyP6R]|uniref:HlyD family secretion protein n=1 Tax=Methylobacterium sp. SyP6R TaxID=2718876 RepID=UPI001F36BEC4|nr:HlyD family efflux transporter periplasmic adaptor subunit [Methylobacterium sp. SyP6R]MCF4129561.1 HlyD family efflux transporter periplasmic adaptor subunit [Methylobacterium sp. SyP6R]